MSSQIQSIILLELNEDMLAESKSENISESPLINNHQNQLCCPVVAQMWSILDVFLSSQWVKSILDDIHHAGPQLALI